MRESTTFEEFVEARGALAALESIYQYPESLQALITAKTDEEANGND